MATNEKELRSAIESILLVAGEPVTVEGLAEVFGEGEKDAIATALEETRKAFEERAGGFTLEQVAGGWRFVTTAENDGYLKKFFSEQSEGRLSLAALETLAIVAYRQPITAPEVSEIRSVNSSGVIRTLLDRKLVKIAGRKNVVGSPFLYRTTREFLLHFGLNSIQDLPRLEEFAEILGENLAEELLGRPEPSYEMDTVPAEADGVRSSSSESNAPNAAMDSEGVRSADSSEAGAATEAGTDAAGSESLANESADDSAQPGEDKVEWRSSAKKED